MISSNTPNHIPVMPNEVLSLMDLKPRGKYVDGTCGLGGHAEMILSSLSKKGFLLGLDIDKDAIKICKKRLDNFSSNFHIEKKSYSELSSILKILEIGQVDGILLDLGLSSLQLDSQSRGFSFKESSSLDMRFDQDSNVDAADIINKSSESEIADIFYYLGEERRSRLFARRVIERRKISLIDSTEDLASIAYTGRYSKKHPATNIFRAVRMFVNNELGEIKDALMASVSLLNDRGRIAVISFHSMEDRIVKNFFKGKVDGADFDSQLKSIGKIIKPSVAEIQENPRARSAILRIGERSYA